MHEVSPQKSFGIHAEVIEGIIRLLVVAVLAVAPKSLPLLVRLLLMMMLLLLLMMLLLLLILLWQLLMMLLLLILL